MMSVDKTETPLMRKIRLLMAKAQGTNNENEAAAFAAKVQELLLENGLSAADIDVTAGQRPEQVGEHEPQGAGRGGKDFLRSPARRVLLTAVVQFYMCSYLRWGNERVVIVGKRANADVAVEMMNYLLTTTVRLSNAYGRETGGKIIDFRRGCMLRLADRLNAMRREREEAARRPQPNGGSNLPALFVSESALVTSYLNQRAGVRAGRAARIKQGRDAAAGYRAADGISLNPQVGASRTGTKLIGGGR